MGQPPSHRITVKSKAKGDIANALALWPGRRDGTWSVRLERGWQLLSPDGLLLDGTQHYLDMYENKAREEPRQQTEDPQGGDDDIPF
jgi:hypothetical protein